MSCASIISLVLYVLGFGAEVVAAVLAVKATREFRVFLNEEEGTFSIDGPIETPGDGGKDWQRSRRRAWAVVIWIIVGASIGLAGNVVSLWA